MTYASTAELVGLSGSSLPVAVLQGHLDEADRQIKGRLLAADVSPPSSSDCLKSAALSLGKASLLDRLRLDGSNVSDPMYSWNADELNQAIVQLIAVAWVLVDSFIVTSKSERHRWCISKVNG